MKTILIVLSFCLSLVSQASEKGKGKPSMPNRLICKTGMEKRPAGQALKLYFNYNLPFVFEAEDPTQPLGRQVLLLAGRPVVQLFFEKAPAAAGEQGENLQPMQCAFAKRAVRANEPSVVQILLPSSQVSWLSQPLGQRGGAEKMTVQPAGDWTFAYEHERVFTVELEDLKNFFSLQTPKAL